MSAAFTPGPWEAHTFSLTTADRRHRLAHFGPITGKGRSDSTRESEANCQLAAAAPKLYEALESAARTLNNIAMIADEGSAVRLQAEAEIGAVERAIAKARGKS